MTTTQAVEFITGTHGRIFAVEFVKRSTGELRLMNCRTDVSKYVTGAGLSYDPKAKGLITVFDMCKHGYRSIPVDGIQRIKVDGEWQFVVAENTLENSAFSS